MIHNTYFKLSQNNRQWHSSSSDDLRMLKLTQQTITADNISRLFTRFKYVQKSTGPKKGVSVTNFKEIIQTISQTYHVLVEVNKNLLHHATLKQLGKKEGVAKSCQITVKNKANVFAGYSFSIIEVPSNFGFPSYTSPPKIWNTDAHHIIRATKTSNKLLQSNPIWTSLFLRR